ncbi:MAG: dihydrolipoamide acetyltransferase family protein [Pseudomonadota bacterium]
MSIAAITVPKWGIEMQEATLADWKLEVGTSVSKGDELVDMETEKIINTVEAPADGVLRRCIGESGAVYEVGKLLGVIAAADTPDADIDAFVSAFVPVDASFAEGDAASPPPESPSADTVAPATNGEVRISPIARKLAEQLGVDWSGITGTGRNGRISKQDIEEAAARLQQDEPLPRTSLQRTVATRMQAAKEEVPHFYLGVDINCDAAQARRRTYNEQHNCRVTLNDMLLRAVSMTLADSPRVNVIYRDGELYRADDGVGVAIASKDGLMAPVIKGVAGKSLKSISADTKRLAEAANNRTLEKEDLAGGATTVSNLGMFGVDTFTAIINPPQASILAVGKAQPRVIVADDGAMGVADIMPVMMSCDHRAFDGADAAEFLGKLRQLLEDPEQLERLFI